MLNVCTVEGCDRRAEARGLCNKHYQAWHRVHGEAAREERKRARAAAAVEKDPPRLIVLRLPEMKHQPAELSFIKTGFGEAAVKTVELSYAMEEQIMQSIRLALTLSGLKVDAPSRRRGVPDRIAFDAAAVAAQAQQVDLTRGPQEDELDSETESCLQNVD